MTAPEDRIRVVWTSDHDANGNQLGRLACPHDGCTPDVTVNTHPAAAAAIAAHIDLHLPDGTVHGHLLDRDAVPRVGDHVDIDPDRTLRVARLLGDTSGWCEDDFRLPPHPGLMAKSEWCYLTADQLDRLDHASLIVAKALDVPYLVGSVLIHQSWRDVDVRVVLDDDEYARLFRGPGQRRTDPFWSLLCASVSEHLNRMTGLPVDFQVQNRTYATEKFGGRARHPLGIYPVE